MQTQDNLNPNATNILMFFVVFAFVELVPKSCAIWQKTSLMDSSLAFQSRVHYNRDISFQNSFETC